MRGAVIGRRLRQREGEAGVVELASWYMDAAEQVLGLDVGDPLDRLAPVQSSRDVPMLSLPASTS